MELDQNLFSFFLKFKKKHKDGALKKKKESLYAVELKTVKDSLSIYASAVFEQSIEIRETIELPYRSGNKLFLPSFLAIGKTYSDNILAYQFVILHLYAISQFYSASNKSLSLLDNLNQMNALIPKARELLNSLFPNYQVLYNQLTATWSDADKRYELLSYTQIHSFEYIGFDPLAFWGQLPRLTNLIQGSNIEPEMREALPDAATERQAKSRGKIKKIEMEENKENIGQDVFHHFEKVETAEEYKGVQRDTDGADELAAHADALDDLNLEDVVRTSKAAKSLYKTELDMGFEIADLREERELICAEKVFFYDEWDEKKRIYKKDWCRVVQSSGELITEEIKKEKWLKDTVNRRNMEVTKLKKKLIKLASEVRVFKRLLAGRDIDIDNVVRNASLRKNGGSGDQRYYQESKKRHRDMACILLVDTSLSSDSWVQNKRILDVSLEALLIFGEASKDLGDPILVAGFNSNTRHDCKFIEWKSFDDHWEKFTRAVDHITPAGYTRIGPAIRHATNLLSKRKERNKLLLVFTDGRPTDFDRYEGHYGLSDVRQAVRESDQCGVVTFALAIDPSAKQFLPQLFGMGNFQIMHNLETLPDVLAKLYAKMSKNK